MAAWTPVPGSATPYAHVHVWRVFTATKELSPMPAQRPRVVVIGAGFGGLNAARTLRRADVDVLVIDQHNFHTFQPLLYQVATAGLDAGDIAHQVRGIFRAQRNLRFLMGRVTAVDWETRSVELESGAREAFDYLVIGAGAVYHDFGTPGVFDHGFVLKSLHEAVALRSHMLRQFERAAADPGHVERGGLTFVIVGAGPTGVEMAGAMVELFDRVLPSDYPELDVGRAKVVLLEMTDRVLAPYGERSRAYAERVLRARGVDVRLGTAVAEVHQDHVVLADGERLATHTLIWAAGVRAHPLADVLGAPLGRASRVALAHDLSLADHPEAFVIGDMAGPIGEDGTVYPQVAQVAIQQGKHAAATILRRLRGEGGTPFAYADRGQMAIIGRSAGVAELSRRLGGFRFTGFLGWLSWLFIHLVYLPGHQNRVNAFTNWTVNFLTYERHARLILDEETPRDEQVGRGTIEG
jgi:NADH:ubiquinone reductase (H+-translocating)